MAEPGFTRNGALAGLSSGFVYAVLIYYNLPSPEEIVSHLDETGYGGPIDPARLEAILRILLPLSGLFAVAFMVILGVLFGALHGFIYERKRLGMKASAAISGILMTAFLVLPNIPFSANGQVWTNAIVGITYTLALISLTLKRDPRSYHEEPPDMV